MREYTKREEKEFNPLRSFAQWFVCRVMFLSYMKLVYNLKVEGRENIPSKKENSFIVASNHISNSDPFLLAGAFDESIAFMAKEELFEKFVSRTIMDWCGAFAVKRDKVGVSTIKTALSIKNTGWSLGLFPQGTRDTGDKVEKITKGFATFAKATKSDILPVAIIGADKKPKLFGSENLTIKIGKVIPYSDCVEDMMHQWCASVSEMSGKEYRLAEG